jgi:hypothetical protein
VEGKDSEVALFEIIMEKNLIVKYISDDDIAHLVDNYTNLRSFYGREDDHNAMVIRDDGGNTCLSSHACKSHQRLPLPLTFIVLAILQSGSSTNGFVHSSSLQEHHDTRSFLPLHP